MTHAKAVNEKDETLQLTEKNVPVFPTVIAAAIIKKNNCTHVVT